MKIRCLHKNENGIVCNNIIGVRTGNTLVVTRHGRTVRIYLTEKATEIQCERCAGITRLYANMKA